MQITWPSKNRSYDRISNFSLFTNLYNIRRSAELEARRKREEEIRAKEKDSSVTVEENAASKDKDGLWVVNKHGLVLPVLRIANNNGVSTGIYYIAL